MATITKRGKRWRVEIRRGDVKLSETFGSKSEASSWAASREAEIVAQQRGQVVAGRTLKDALKAYATKVSPTHKGTHWEQVRLTMFERIIPFVGRALDRISPADIASFRDDRLESVSASSVRRELGLLSAVFEVARKEWRWTASNPLRDVRKPTEAPHRTRTVTASEWRALCRAVGWRPGQMPQTKTAWAVAAFCFATRTAMRAGELLSLRSVDLKRRVAHLPVTKNGKARDVPLSRQAVRIIEGLAAKSSNISNSDIRTIRATGLIPLTSADLDTLFRRARGLAMIEGLTFHDSRHSATTMLAKKLPVMDLARVTGHSDLKQLLKYYNPDAASLADRLR